MAATSGGRQRATSRRRRRGHAPPTMASLAPPSTSATIASSRSSARSARPPCRSMRVEQRPLEQRPPWQSLLTCHTSRSARSSSARRCSRCPLPHEPQRPAEQRPLPSAILTLRTSRSGPRAAPLLAIAIAAAGAAVARRTAPVAVAVRVRCRRGRTARRTAPEPAAVRIAAAARPGDGAGVATACAPAPRGDGRRPAAASFRRCVRRRRVHRRYRTTARRPFRRGHRSFSMRASYACRARFLRDRARRRRADLAQSELDAAFCGRGGLPGLVKPRPHEPPAVGERVPSLTPRVDGHTQVPPQKLEQRRQRDQRHIARALPRARRPSATP